MEKVDETTKISAVKQNTFTEFTVTMSKALETVAAADFSMVRDDDNQVITVKSATLDDKDKTQVKLVVYTSLTDAKTYTVTYTAADEAKTQSSAKVTVTDGTVADVAITPLEITANQATLIEYQTLDANGVVVSQKGASKAESKVDVSWDSLLGTMDDATSKYILYNEGDTAKFTVTYHTYKYDTTTGAELGVITKDFTVTAVKDASVVSQFVYTAATSKPFDWSKVTPKQTIALNDEGASQRTAYFLIKDSKGNNVTATCGYTVESSDNSIVVADGDVKDGAALTPVNKGSAYLMIKDGDGKVVNTMPITVGDKRTVSVFTLSSQSVKIVSSASLSSKPEACAFVDVTAKDQYGDDINVTLDSEKKEGKDVAQISITGKTVSVQGETTAAVGTEKFLIKGTDDLGKSKSILLTVNTVDPTGASTYSVVFLDNNKVVSSVDTTISETDSTAPADQKLNVVIVEKKAGVVIGKVSSADVKSLKVVKVGDKTIAEAKSTSAKTVTSSAIDDTAIAGVTGTGISGDVLNITARKTTGTNAEKLLGVGTYTVSYEIETTVGSATKTNKAVASFTVKDTQTAVTAKVKETACGDTNSLSAVFGDENFVEFYYGNEKVSATYQSADSKVNTNGKNVYVKSVTVQVPVANTNNTMTVVVPVNKTFTSNNAWS